MPPLCEEQNVVGGNFKWGNKRGTGLKNKDTQFYESFVYDGVEYFLYDSVYFYHTDHVNTSIGKLVKMYEKSSGQKNIKVVWFFRPSEIRNFLTNYQPSWNELFLASGKSIGVSNINLLESIIGKCRVVCTSNDKRNPKPSEKELVRADFFFKCTFDVDRRVIDDKFADKIDGIEVEKFFNRKGDKMTSNNLSLETSKPPKAIKIQKRTFENEVKDKVKTKTASSDILRCKVKDEVRTSENEVKDKVKTKTASSDILRCKVKDEVRTSENVSRYLKIRIRTSENVKDKYEVKSEVKDEVMTKTDPSYQVKKRKIIEEKSNIGHSSNIQKKEEFDEKEELRQDERPNAEKRKWFKKMPWEGRLQKAQESDTLVLLTNLDPSYTSYEVEELVWQALKERVEARMIESSLTSNPYYGTALVIFRTKDAAGNAISELNRRCLILKDGRVVSARNRTVRDPVKKSTFNGHLSISRAALHKQCREMRNAVSTSHCSQSNTIEYSMAIEWTQKHDQSEACWKALCEKQMKEIEDVQSKLRIDKIFLEDS